MTGQSGDLSPSSVVLGVVGLGLHLVLGFLIFTSTLVAPAWAVALLLAIWAFLGVVGWREWQQRPALALVIPLVTAGLWILALWLGGELLGWTA